MSEESKKEKVLKELKIIFKGNLPISKKDDEPYFSLITIESIIDDFLQKEHQNDG